MRLFRPYPRIALAGPAEAPLLAQLYARCWGADGLADQRPDAAAVTSWFAGGFEVYRAALEGRLAGAVRVSFPTGTVMLDMLAVDPERRRRGVGRALLNHGLNRGRKAGLRRAWVQVRPELMGAMALHRSLGFRESGPSGSETVLLELVL